MTSENKPTMDENSDGGGGEMWSMDADESSVSMIFSSEAQLVVNKIKDQAKKAIDVLHKIYEKGQKKVLFPEVDQVIHLQCVYKKPDMKNCGFKNKTIILPHAIHDKTNTTICLIMRDLDMSDEVRCDPDVDKQARQWTEKLETEHSVTKQHVQKVLTKRQMEREYASYNDKRQLASAYDIFLVDSVVQKSVYHICGKEFHKAKKLPLSVVLRSPNSLLKQIDLAHHTITLPLSAQRTRTSLFVGNLSQSTENLIDNIGFAVKNLFNYCPGGMANIRSINIQMITGGPSLPLFVDCGSRNDVKLPKSMKKTEFMDQRETFGDLTTLPDGLTVSVRRDGEVRVIDSASKKTVLFPTVNDEHEPQDDLKPHIDPKKLEAKQETRKKLRLKRKLKAKNRMQLLPTKLETSGESESLRGITKAFLKGKKRKAGNIFDVVSEKKRKSNSKETKTGSKKGKPQKKSRKLNKA